jgi:hypothetical protein
MCIIYKAVMWASVCNHTSTYTQQQICLQEYKLLDVVEE